MELSSATIFILFFSLSICSATDLHYSQKYMSTVEDDMYGYSIGARNGTLVVGACQEKEDEGTVSVIQGGKVVKKLKPLFGEFFGREVAANDRHIVVAAGRYMSSIYIFSIHQPYTLRVRIPVGGNVFRLAIADDDTIVAALDGSVGGPARVIVYAYDGNDAWHMTTTWKFPRAQPVPIVAIHGDVIAVGVGEEEAGGTVFVYTRREDQWEQSQLIQRPLTNMTHFGDDVTIHDGRLVVGGWDGDDKQYLWVYTYDVTTGQWTADGCVFPRNRKSNDIDLQNDVLAVSVFDETRSGVVSTVYRRTNGGKWVEHATLTAEPLRHDQNANKVVVDGHFVYTSRVSYGNDLGAVYMHDLSQM